MHPTTTFTYRFYPLSWFYFWYFCFDPHSGIRPFGIMLLILIFLFWSS